jgi:dGTPase
LSLPIGSKKFQEWRSARRRGAPLANDDNRSAFQRDRDRILYSEGLRRLGFITQVISPYEHVAVHNRLTHVLKVAQIGRRFAERLISKHAPLETRSGGLDPDVVEAAALAHDLGHPPFGHIVEEKLDALARKAELADGFEGNAQSFRIVTKREMRGSNKGEGLDLTRATLNSILKYPWFRGKAGKHNTKWGAYLSEKDEFIFARECLTTHPLAGEQTLEAQIMDWADDITYAIHDLEDFYRAGKIPLHALKDTIGSRDEIRRVLEHMFNRLRIKERDQEVYSETANGLFAFFPVSEPYSGLRGQRQSLANFANKKLTEFVKLTGIDSKGNLIRPDVLDREITLLKQLTWFYVIENSALAEQQHGQQRMISDLFEIYCNEVESSKAKVIPPNLRQEVKELSGRKDKIRFVIDLLAGMGEQEICKRHQVLMGTAIWNKGFL